MRLLILTPDYPPALGGIQTVMHRLSTLMDFETMVVTRCFDSIPDTWIPAYTAKTKPVIRYVPASAQSQKRSLLRLNLRSLAAAQAFRPTIIISGHIVTSPAASIIGHTTSAPVLQYLYADELTAHPRLTRFALRHANVSVAISEYTWSLALRFGAEPARLRLIPPGVDVPLGSYLQAKRSGRPTLITVARLTDWYKGHDVVLRALPLILKKVPDCEWVVVGDGPLSEELRQLARDEGVDMHVRFLGALNDEQRDALLDQAHVFVMASRVPPGEGGEGFGIAYLEAGLHNLPVIAGNVAGAIDAVEHERTGLLVDPADAQQVANAAIRLLTNPQDAARMGACGAEHARGFAWSLISKRVEGVLREMARGIDLKSMEP